MRELVAAWPPRRHRVDREGAQTLRRRVDRRGEARRAGSDHDDVVAALGQRVGRHTELEGELSWRRPPEHALRCDGDRQIGGVRTDTLQERGDIGLVVGVDPSMRGAGCGRRIRAGQSTPA